MLTETQERALTAVVDRMVPPDDTWPESGWPGGVEAGVLDYFREQFGRDLADLLPEYRTGLDALDAEARADGGTGTFADLAPAEQDALLRRLEAGTAGAADAWKGLSPARFVRRMAEHVAEGFYITPTARRMVGFEFEPKEARS